MPYNSVENQEKNIENIGQVSNHPNSYYLQSCNPFNADIVEQIAQTIMTNYLKNFKYHATECPTLCKQIATDICTEVQKLHFDRYKIVVYVTIVEKRNQSLDSSIAHLWDTQRDNYASFTFEGHSFQAFSCIFGIYYE